ncbi:MAG: hypothetical protein FWG65_10365 [Turicibacter sp.]|nr:hypothetical protein [Turicibacter sp.]
MFLTVKSLSSMGNSDKYIQDTISNQFRELTAFEGRELITYEELINRFAGCYVLLNSVENKAYQGELLAAKKRSATAISDLTHHSLLLDATNVKIRYFYIWCNKQDEEALQDEEYYLRSLDLKG